MANAQRPAGIAQSLLDRLIDLQPGLSKETPVSQWEELREFKAAVCRDLSALLNTRRAERDFDPDYEESTNSLLTYGVVDFTSYNLLNGADQEEVRRSIERAIRQFEPRLSRVSVSVIEPDPLRPVLQFQIEALLDVEPAAEPIVFDVSLHRESRRLAISGGSS